MTDTQQGLMTAEDLLRLDTDQGCELVEGELRMMTPAGFRHGAIAMRLGRRLADHAEPMGLGTVTGEQTGFLLARNPDTVRVPDVGFVGADRLESEPEGYFEGAPDLVAEVVSPDDRAGDVHAKARMWLQAGAKIVWVVWPETCTVTVYRTGQDPRTLREEDVLDGEGVLPGFACGVRDIFAVK